MNIGDILIKRTHSERIINPNLCVIQDSEMDLGPTVDVCNQTRNFII